jgi:hypothetical protein
MNKTMKDTHWQKDRHEAQKLAAFRKEKFPLQAKTSKLLTIIKNCYILSNFKL